MYDAYEVLANIDQHKWKILALCAFAMICNYTWFFAALREARLQQTYSVPLVCCFFWLAGDFSMVWFYDLWFNVYDHWYVKLFWVALLITVAFEIAFTVQAILYGRRELLPELSMGQWTALILCGVVTGFVTWGFIKHHLNDPLYISYFHIANLAGPLFTAGLVAWRRSAIGQTPLIWGAYTLMATSWFIACALWFGGPFAEPLYLALYAITIIASSGVWYVVWRMRKSTLPTNTAMGGVSAA